MIQWARPLAWARSRLGRNNPNWSHLRIAKERRSLERRIYEAVRTLIRISPTIRHPKALVILAELRAGDPDLWTRPMTSGWRHLPRSEMSTARQFLRKFNRLLLMLARIGAGRFWVRPRPTNESGDESNKTRTQRQNYSLGTVQEQIAKLKRWAEAVGEPWHGNGPVIIRE